MSMRCARLERMASIFIENGIGFGSSPDIIRRLIDIRDDKIQCDRVSTTYRLYKENNETKENILILEFDSANTLFGSGDWTMGLLFDGYVMDFRETDIYGEYGYIVDVMCRKPSNMKDEDWNNIRDWNDINKEIFSEIRKNGLI